MYQTTTLELTVTRWPYCDKNNYGLVQVNVLSSRQGVIIMIRIERPAALERTT